MLREVAVDISNSSSSSSSNSTLRGSKGSSSRAAAAVAVAGATLMTSAEVRWLGWLLLPARLPGGASVVFQVLAAV